MTIERGSIADYGIWLGPSVLGFERSSIVNDRVTEYYWNWKKAARNASLLLMILKAPEAYKFMDELTAPSDFKPTTLLETEMNGEIRKQNLVTLAYIFNIEVQETDLLRRLNRIPKPHDYIFNGKPNEYPLAGKYDPEVPNQTVYLPLYLHSKNLGPFSVTGKEEIYLVQETIPLARYRVQDGVNVTRIGNENAREYFLVQPFIDNSNNFNGKKGSLRFRFLDVGEYDEAQSDVVWQKAENNAKWKKLPRGNLSFPENLPNIADLPNVLPGTLPFVSPVPGFGGQKTWRDRITEEIKTFRPYHQIENLSSPLDFLPAGVKEVPQSNLLRSGTYKGRRGSFANSGQPKSYMLKQQKG